VTDALGQDQHLRVHLFRRLAAVRVPLTHGLAQYTPTAAPAYDANDNVLTSYLANARL